MAFYTDQDKQWLQNRKAEGMSKEEAFSILDKIKGSTAETTSKDIIPVASVGVQEPAPPAITPENVYTGKAEIPFSESLLGKVGEGYQEGKQIVEQRKALAAQSGAPEIAAASQTAGNILLPIMGAITKPTETIVDRAISSLPMTPGTEEASKIVAESATPIIPKEKIDNFIANLSPEQKQFLDEAGLTARFLASAYGIGETYRAVKPALNGLMKKSPEVATAKTLSKIEETIKPKMTKGETMKAYQEGRITKTEYSPITGKKADIVAPSARTQSAAQVIERRIGKQAANMNEAQLLGANQAEIGKISSELEKELKGTIMSNTNKKLVKDTWNTVKENQLKKSAFKGKAADNMRQEFEEEVLSKLDSPVPGQPGKWKTLEDTWNARKLYDDMILENVKNATPKNGALWNKKQMWLQNREVLNKALEDQVQGLGQITKDAFSDMNKLYNANQDILPKATVDLKGKPGALTGTLKKALLYGAGGLGVGTGARSLLQ